MKKVILNAIIAFVLVGALLVFQRISHNSKTNKWPSVRGIVVISIVKKELKNVNPRYKPFIQYEYIVENVEYEQTYYDSLSSGYLSKEDALEITKRFPEGKEIVIHYNPDNPDDSIIRDLQ